MKPKHCISLLISYIILSCLRVKDKPELVILVSVNALYRINLVALCWTFSRAVICFNRDGVQTSLAYSVWVDKGLKNCCETLFIHVVEGTLYYAHH